MKSELELFLCCASELISPSGEFAWVDFRLRRDDPEWGTEDLTAREPQRVNMYTFLTWTHLLRMGRCHMDPMLLSYTWVCSSANSK